MNFKQISDLIKKNNIPENVHFLSDSGWECGPSDMDVVYYNKLENTIVFTQYADTYGRYGNNKDWIKLL